MAIKSNLLGSIKNIEHGFGTRLEPIALELKEVWEKKHPQWKQDHGNKWAEVKSPDQSCGNVDALYTAEPSIPIAVVTADCVPILLAKKDGTQVAAVHAGWRGTQAKILAELWKRLTSQGENPKNWIAAIGPAIGPCCYEVSQTLYDNFLKELEPATTKNANFIKNRFLDLPGINADALNKIGLSEVELIRKCTKCSRRTDDSFEFFSYRREGAGTRQWSMIIRRSNH